MRLARIRAALLAGLTLLLVHAPVRAQAPELSVTLLTFGNGDQVYEKFGHNAIWIHDPIHGTDKVYNYGLFDFNSPGYWGRFIKGTWLYQIGVADMYQTMAEYEYLNRTVSAQELNLTLEQKLELQQFLDWNARPENAQYLYDYFRDNCSTRVRDAIDRVLGGQLKKATTGVATGTTYRWHSRRLLSDEPVIYTGLETGLGEGADRPIDAWEQMFLPEKVQEVVRGVEVTRDDGTRVPLVLRERELYTASGRPPEPTAPPSWIAGYLLAGLAFGAALAGLAAGAVRHRSARLGFSVLSAVWALVVGLGGVLLLGLWAFTDHTIAYRNENLLQFTPLALPLLVLAPAVAYRARWAVRPARAIAAAAALSALLGLMIQVLPGIDQVNGEIIALLLPGHLALAWALARIPTRGV